FELAWTVGVDPDEEEPGEGEEGEAGSQTGDGQTEEAGGGRAGQEMTL
ncbi:MAG: hypothetical protein HRU13_08635, partial [Phycisphaerales bacterium]|nr:hypothetical protein [Phycisphaerales bacterium]